MDITNVNTNGASALATAVKGVRDSEVRFTKAADDVVKTYAAASNVVSSATSADEVSPETLQAAADPIQPMVDMKTASMAYKANLEVFSVIDQMSEELIDILA